MDFLTVRIKEGSAGVSAVITAVVLERLTTSCPVALLSSVCLLSLNLTMLATILCVSPCTASFSSLS